MVDNYAVYLQRPFLKQFRRAKWFYDGLLITSCVILTFWVAFTNGGSKASKAVIGEVLMSAGSIPVLLSAPLILSDWTVGLLHHQELKKLCQCFCLRDRNLFFAYLFYFVCLIVGMILLLTEEGDDLSGFYLACAEIFAEVGIIYGITTLLGVASVETDDTAPFLSVDEKAQVERSGTVFAPYAPATDFVLVNACKTRNFADTDYDAQLHEWMDYHYPSDIDNNYDNVEEQFEDQIADYGAPGRERQLASEILMDTPPGWDSSWYVSALGYCDHTRIPDLIPGLLSFLSGAAFPRDRYIVQAAVTSLGNLYFGTQSRKISQRLMTMWLTHEISNIRDYCVVAIEAIGDPLTVAFMKQLQNPKDIRSGAVANQYYEEMMMRTDPLRVGSISEITEALRMRGSFDLRMMYFIRACELLDENAGGTFSLSDLAPFISRAGERVLVEPLESHVVKQLCLEAVRRAVKRCSKLPEPWEGSPLQQEVFQLCNWACRTSVFKQVRNLAKDVLQEANYPYMSIYPCFATSGATDTYEKEGCSSEVISSVLQNNMGDLYFRLAHKVNSWEDPWSELVQMFDAQEDTQRAIDDRAMMRPDDDPVVLLYVYLAECDDPAFEDYHVQERLNAVDRFERYVGLLCIGKMGRKLSKLREQVLPQFTERELISDVRDLAEAVKSDDGTKQDTEYVCGCIPSWVADMCTGVSSSAGDKRNAFVEEEFKLLKERIKVSQAPQLQETSNSLEDTQDESAPLVAGQRKKKSPYVMPVAYSFDDKQMPSGSATLPTVQPATAAAFPSMLYPAVSAPMPPGGSLYPTGTMRSPPPLVMPANSQVMPANSQVMPANSQVMPANGY